MSANHGNEERWLRGSTSLALKRRGPDVRARPAVGRGGAEAAQPVDHDVLRGFFLRMVSAMPTCSSTISGSVAQIETAIISASTRYLRIAICEVDLHRRTCGSRRSRLGVLCVSMSGRAGGGGSDLPVVGAGRLLRSKATNGRLKRTGRATRHGCSRRSGSGCGVVEQLPPSLHR